MANHQLTIPIAPRSRPSSLISRLSIMLTSHLSRTSSMFETSSTATHRPIGLTGILLVLTTDGLNVLWLKPVSAIPHQQPVSSFSGGSLCSVSQKLVGTLALLQRQRIVTTRTKSVASVLGTSKIKKASSTRLGAHQAVT